MVPYNLNHDMPCMWSLLSKLILQVLLYTEQCSLAFEVILMSVQFCTIIVHVQHVHVHQKSHTDYQGHYMHGPRYTEKCFNTVPIIYRRLYCTYHN